MYFHNLIPPFFWSRYEQEAHGISYSSKLAIQNEQKTNVPSNCSVKDRVIIIALNKKAKKMQFLIEKNNHVPCLLRVMKKRPEEVFPECST
jgi:hypothetical protein